MGQMRFLTANAESIGAWEVECAYLAGLEGTPWRSRNTLENGMLTVDRGVDESGNLFLPWQTTELGPTTLSSASLRESNSPYLLPLEIARGTVNRVRSQEADWRLAGLQVNDAITEQLRLATTAFVDAATRHHRDTEQAAELSNQAINLAIDAIRPLTQLYSSQSLAVRRSQSNNKLPTLLAGNIDLLPASPGDIQAPYLSAFNSASVSIRWRDVEPNAGEYDWETLDRRIQWCQANGLRVCAGPLLRLDRLSMPDWVYLWEDDFEQLANFLIQFIQNAVNRYRGQVHVWQAAARLNVGCDLALGEEQRLRLAVACVDAVRRLDPQTPTVVNFDQPWGEYLAREDMELSPLHFADTLIRAELGLAGLGLEINLGYWPNGTLPRNLLEVSRAIDRWSILGLPLLVVLCGPSQAGEDPLAESRIRNIAHRDLQQDVAEIVQLLLAKPTVHGIIWNQLTDAVEHEFPFGGLFGADSAPKPLLRQLADIRGENLM